MKLFFDTSSFIKLFVSENGSDTVKALVNDENNQLFALHLIRLEAVSAVFRRARSGEITVQNARNFQTTIDRVLQFWNVEPVTEIIISEAENLITEYGLSYGLRSLDAIHLAGFLLNADEDWKFICSDVKLADIVKKTGYEVIIP